MRQSPSKRQTAGMTQFDIMSKFNSSGRKQYSILKQNSGLGSSHDYQDAHGTSQGLGTLQSKKNKLNSPRSNIQSSISSHNELPPAKRKSISKMKMIQNQTIQPSETSTNKEKSKNYGLNLSVNTDKRFSNEMDGASPYQNPRQSAVNSGDLSPDIK